MARVELADFPTGKWDEGQNLGKLTTSETLFTRALHYNPWNRTANHRLGLIAMLRRDFPLAVSYLKAAYQADQNHRGIWKALGYSYVWTGQFDQAIALLTHIPEARQELEIYPWWWRTQGQDILASRAETMAKQLQALELLPPTVIPVP